MFNILKSLNNKNNKNHITMILVLLTLLIIIPINVRAKMADYSKFNWDNYYETNKFMWGEICYESDLDENGNCTEDRLLLGQKKFFIRTYKILAKYQKHGLVISDDLVITTALYGLHIEHTGNDEGNADYKNRFYDEDFEQKVENGLNYDDDIDDDTYDTEDTYDEKGAESIQSETDTMITLIKNSIADYTYCYGIYGDPVEQTKTDGTKYYTCPDGGTRTKIHYRNGLLRTSKYKCATNISASSTAKGYELGHWEYFASRLKYDSVLSIPMKIFGSEIKDEYRDKCEEEKANYKEGTEYQYVDEDEKEDKHVSTNKYFDFLKESRYFDKKPHLQNYFEDILKEANVDCLVDSVCKNSLESTGRYDEFEEELQDIRIFIIRQIIDILNENGISMQYDGYGTLEYDEATYNNTERSGFYWPIGSIAATTKTVTLSDGSVKELVFADGTPAYTMDNITSYFGERIHPITGQKKMHRGIDIGVPEGTNIIAASDGTVVSIVNGCVKGNQSCGGGYGNHVIISHPNGDYTVYAHLLSVDSQIQLNGPVLRGELIAKSGTTGASTGPHLHYELRIGGNSSANAVDPLTNTSAGKSTPPNVADLRPTAYNASGIGARSTKFSGTSLTSTEFSGRVRSYCSTHGGEIALAMCNDPELVYETSRNADVNPELVITRAMAEGNSPGSRKNNYWGMGCTNTGGYDACITYGSLEEGIRGFAGTVTKYDNLMSMQLKYAYIGKYWYNPGSWSVGGCKYFQHIKGFMSEQRQGEVTAICGKSTECTTTGGDCTPTTQEDQNAYATWQVEKKLGPYMHNVFGT